MGLYEKEDEVKDKSETNILLVYCCVVFGPTHIIPIFFWIYFYFYYGAQVNSSF